MTYLIKGPYITFFLFYLQGKPIDFSGVDEITARWVQDFSVKPYATPAKLESIDGGDDYVHDFPLVFVFLAFDHSAKLP